MRFFTRRLINATRIWDYLLSGWPARLRLISPHAATRTPSRAPLALLPLEARLVPTGDILVNTYPTNVSTDATLAPAVASDAAGDFVTIWTGTGPSGDGVYGQRFTASGAKAGSEFLVAGGGETGASSVAMDADGDFVVVWWNSTVGIEGQRYAADGTTQGSTFTVTSNQYDPASVAMDAAGDFVVVWTNLATNDITIDAQRYSASGGAQGTAFQVSTSPIVGTGTGHSVAMDAAGDFVIAWAGYSPDGSSYSVYARRYAASGTAQGGEFQVGTITTGELKTSTLQSVSMDAAGDFVVAWTNDGQDGSNYGVYAQRYSANGTAQGGAFLVNTYTTGNQIDPSVAMDANGDFIITWQSLYQDGSGYGVYAQLYSANGTAQGSEFRVNSFTTGNQAFASVAMDAAGDYVAVWGGPGPGDPDGIFTTGLVTAP